MIGYGVTKRLLTLHAKSRSVCLSPTNVRFKFGIISIMSSRALCSALLSGMRDCGAASNSFSVAASATRPFSGIEGARYWMLDGKAKLRKVCWSQIREQRQLIYGEKRTYLGAFTYVCLHRGYLLIVPAIPHSGVSAGVPTPRLRIPLTTAEMIGLPASLIVISCTAMHTLNYTASETFSNLNYWSA